MKLNWPADAGVYHSERDCCQESLVGRVILGVDHPEHGLDGGQHEVDAAHDDHSVEGGPQPRLHYAVTETDNDYQDPKIKKK